MTSPPPPKQHDDRSAVALVGHCGPDAWMLKSMASRTLPDAEIVMINSQRELDESRAALRVLLVNRVLDGDFPSESGIELIKTMNEARDLGTVPISVLISNYDDAQEQAEDAGAAPGFGKADTNSPVAADRLRAAWDG